jgi:hypothetical protein
MIELKNLLIERRILVNIAGVVVILPPVLLMLYILARITYETGILGIATLVGSVVWISAAFYWIYASIEKTRRTHQGLQ